MKTPSPSPGAVASQAGLFTRSERNRMIAMVVVLVGLVIAFVASVAQKEKHERAGEENLPDERVYTETVDLPDLDRELLAGKIRDTQPGDRILIETGPSQALFRFVARFLGPHYKALGISDLTRETVREMYADPEPFRARPYRVRGWVEELYSRQLDGGGQEHSGWIRLEDRSVVHFLVHRVDAGIIRDDFVRLDGVFFKLFHDEGETGWEEGPFLIGTRIVRSYDSVEPFDKEHFARRLASVTDDSAEDISGMTSGPAFDAQWMLLDHARGESAAGVDWEGAPELDNQAMVELLVNGAPHRGAPYLIPISRSLGIWTQDPGENPARLDRVTTGWIGNFTWTNQAGLIQFIMAGEQPQLRESELVLGRGFFLKNFAYEPRDGGLRVAPFFVVESLEPYIAPFDPTADYIMYGIVAVTLVLISSFAAFLLWDKRRSLSLKEELGRRKRERRQRAAGADT
ncbi:MAG: hypothetical protein QGI46_01070 [Planctomycetota bacterium]|jgi:hypothetical protein|nr:hypothetical protein [Planctomycetota bacterium]